jgi:dUTP pyrophosphatase
MKIFKASESAQLPEFATEGSACFDLRVCLEENTKMQAFNPHNKEMYIPVKRDSAGRLFTQIQPSFRTLVPTGLIFDIPKNHELKIYIRSSMALKYGLNLANSNAVIDSDYVDPTYIMVFNMSDTPITLYHGDRIAQAQLNKLLDYTLTERKTAPERKTDRDGGLGSTGVE